MQEHEATDSTSPSRPVPSMGYFVPMNEVSEVNANIRFGDFLSAIKSRRNTVVFVTALCSLLSLAVALWLPPIYRSEVLLAPVVPDGVNSNSRVSGIAAQFGGLVSLAGINAGSAIQPKDTAVATLKSRALTERFISENNLMPILFANRWDAEKSQWSGSDVAPTVGNAYEVFHTKVRQVSEDKKTGLITVSIEWTDRQMAADWANGIVKLANAYLRNAAIENSAKNIAYLKELSLKTSVVELQETIYRLMEGEIKKSMLASVSEQYAFMVIDPAVAPDRKIRPNRLMILILGTVGGLVAGSTLAFIKANKASR